MSEVPTENGSVLGKRKQRDTGARDAEGRINFDSVPLHKEDPTSSQYHWDQLQLSIKSRLSKLAEAEEQMRRQARWLAARQEEVQQKEALLDKQQKLLVSLRKELARQEAAAAKAVQELEARLRAGQAVMRNGCVMGTNRASQGQADLPRQQPMQWPPRTLPTSDPSAGAGPSPEAVNIAATYIQQPSAKRQATARTTSQPSQFPFSAPTPVPGNLPPPRQQSAGFAQQGASQPGFSSGPPVQDPAPAQPSGPSTQFNGPGKGHPFAPSAQFGVPASLGNPVRGTHSRPAASKPNPFASRPDSGSVFGSVPHGEPTAGLSTPGGPPAAQSLPSDAQERPPTAQSPPQSAQRQPSSQSLPSGGSLNGDPMQVDSSPTRADAEQRSHPQERCDAKTGTGDGQRGEGRRETGASAGEGGGPRASGQRSVGKEGGSGETGGFREAVGAVSGGVGGDGIAKESSRGRDGGVGDVEDDALGEDGHVEVVDREDEPADKEQASSGRRGAAGEKPEKGGGAQDSNRGPKDSNRSPEAAAPGEDFIALPPSSPDISAGDFSAGASRGFRSARYRVSGGVLHPTVPQSSEKSPKDASAKTDRAAQPGTAPEGPGPRRPGTRGAISGGRRPVLVPWKYRGTETSPPNRSYIRPVEAGRRRDFAHRASDASQERNSAKGGRMRGRAVFQGRPGDSPVGNSTASGVRPRSLSGRGSQRAVPGAPPHARAPRRVSLHRTIGSPRAVPPVPPGLDVGVDQSKLGSPDSGGLGRAVSRLAKLADSEPAPAPSTAEGLAPGPATADKDGASAKERGARTGGRSPAQDAAERALQADAPELLRMIKERNAYHVPMLLNPNRDADVATDSQEMDAELDRLGPAALSLAVLDSARTCLSRVWKGGNAADPWKKAGGKVEDPADTLRDSRYTVSSLQWLVEHAEADHVAGQPRQTIWGWCRELHAFVFVFEKANTIVVERPEYGYATYFFYLEEPMSILDQVRRLIAVLSSPGFGRAFLLDANKLQLPSDLPASELEALQQCGWVPSQPISSLLNFSGERIMHSKQKSGEAGSREYRERIRRVLAAHAVSGRTHKSPPPRSPPSRRGLRSTKSSA